MPKTVTGADVAAYIVRERGPVPQLLLHKLLYYSQAASRVWDRVSLFNDRIEAWVNGPVVRSIWDRFQYEPTIYSVPGGNAEAMDQ